MMCNPYKKEELELKSAFAGGVGQGLDASVVLVGVAIEGDGIDAGIRGFFGNQLTNLPGTIDGWLCFDFFGGCAAERATGFIINQLDADIGK